MTKQDHLLTILIEECSEVQKVACKCLRFGQNDANPATKVTNWDELTHEINDLLAIIKLLNIEEDGNKQLRKSAKIGYWLEYSKEKGRLREYATGCVVPKAGSEPIHAIWSVGDLMNAAVGTLDATGSETGKISFQTVKGTP